MNSEPHITVATGGGRRGEPESRGPRGIQSVEVGGQLLKALVRSGTALPLRDLARAAGMAPAKAHPYLVSFGKIGLIEQDPVSGHYGLGPLALQLGLIGLQQVDPVRLTVAELPALARAMGCTVSAAVWGSVGPVIVHVEHGPTPVHVAMRHGTPASLRHTGTGKIFAAFAPAAAVAEALAREGEASALQDAAFAAELNAIRSERLSRVRDELLPGISAMAVPVFDGFGRLALAIAAIAPSALLDLRPGSAQAITLQTCAERLSQRLGAVGAA
ncbi:MAG: IclR family transcriptional regulator [Tepidimonas sp.]|uniref:IclR family transcriptional regulator n=1 Tax=Tepidimonas sp. TaxID=2002775 RepID=UPI004054ADC6